MEVPAMLELFLVQEWFWLCASFQTAMWPLSLEERRHGLLMPEVGVGGRPLCL
jgi:hypothetical protein